MFSDHDAREKIRTRWVGLDPQSLASAALKPALGQSGDWDPPPGVQAPADLLALSIGIPDAASLPREAMAEAFLVVLQRPDDAALRYGMRGGYLPLRSYLAEKYTRERGQSVEADWFQLYNGSSGAIDAVARALIDPGDVIFTESPTYMGTLRNFRALQADVRSVPMDEHGLCVDALADGVRRCRREGQRVKLAYTISAFQNPTGRTLSAERRVALLELAAAEGFLILDDDAYGDLYYEARPDVPALSSLADGYGVITVGSFSKVLATGLRVGWVHARPELLAMFAGMRFDMGQNQLALHMIARLAREGRLDAHVATVRGVYKTKMHLLADALERQAGRYLGFERPAGGFYLWAALSSGLTAEGVWRTAYQEGVAINSGHGFFPGRRDPGEHLRIAFAWTPTARIEEAAGRLARACERVAAGDPA